MAVIRLVQETVYDSEESEGWGRTKAAGQGR